MGEKDIAEKILEDYNDVFSDIVNVLLFDGKYVVREDALVNTKDKSQYKIDGKLHEQERDVSKIWKDGKAIISLLGLENQTTLDKYMPIRVMAYDAASYKAQLVNENKKLYPVVTLVLYFGENRWDKYLSLHEIVDIPEDMKSDVNDYKINVFEIAYLTEEQVNMFTSDFKIIADYFVQKRLKGEYEGSKETVKHIDEFLKLMAALTGDDDFVESKGIQNLKKKGEVNMCEMLNAMKKTAREEGRVEGRVEAFISLVKDGVITIEEAAERTKMTIEEVEEIVEQS